MSLFIQLPIVSTRNYGTVSSSDITPLSTAEADLFARFEFNGDLLAANNKRLSLTPQTTGAHTLNTGYVTYNTAKNKALMSSFKTVDYPTKGITVCGMFRIPTLGTTLASDALIFGDHPVFGNHQGFYRSLAKSTQNSLGGVVKPTIGIGLTSATNDSWVFLAMTIDRNTLTNWAVLNKSTAVDNFATGQTTSKMPDSTYPISLGAVAYTSDERTLDCAEFSIYTRYMSRTELNDLYTAAKTRMAAKGFIV